VAIEALEMLEARELKTAGLAAVAIGHPAGLVSGVEVHRTGPVHRFTEQAAVSLPKSPLVHPQPAKGGVLSLPPDLILSKLDVADLGNNQFRVTATLVNSVSVFPFPSKPAIKHAPVSSYPGGGVLVIHRTSGGTTLIPPGSPGAPAIPDPGTDLASMPIPALKFGQSITLSVVTSGRAIFSAAAVPDPVTHTPLPEINRFNDSMTNDVLIPHSIIIDSNLVGSLLGSTQAQIDRDDSFFTIPGVFDKHFQIPATSVGPFDYYFHLIESNGATGSIQNGALVLTVSFADNHNAFHTDSIFAPDLNVKGLTMTLTFPLAYDSTNQMLTYHDASAQVQGVWDPNGVLSGIIKQVLGDPSTTLNSKLSGGITPILNDPATVAQIEFGINQIIHNVIPGGRIAGAIIASSQVTLNTETP
jgi:hypothetical protein